MPIPVENVETAALDLLKQGVTMDRIIVFADHPEYPNYLHVEPLDSRSRDEFLGLHKDWMSRLMILNGLHLLDAFLDLLAEEEYCPLFASSTATMLTNHERWSRELQIPGYTLRPFQNFCMNQALERAREGQTNSERFYFWNWSAGAGKSFCCGAGARALYESDDIDLVILCTLNDVLKENVRRDLTRYAGLRAVINDHSTPATRHERYMSWSEDGVAQVFVMNYEKLRVDEEAIGAVIKDKRVLFILDEGHKLIAETGQNQARKALDRLTRTCKAIVWPMSATVVGGSPLRFRDVFSLDSYSRNNPLDTKENFIARYADSATTVQVKTKKGGFFPLTTYEWNLPGLQEVRHRVGERTMAVRKTDPGIREQFKGIECLPEWVPMTKELAEIDQIILEDARDAREKGMSRAPHYLALRIAHINPAALQYSHNEISQKLVNEYPELLATQHSNKLEMLNTRLESIRESQDKAIVFCHWTDLGILPLRDKISVPHVIHYGEMTAKDRIRAQDRFKADPDLTCFLSSDAGTHGLNFQEARYVISLDPLYSYDDLCQRNARIDRADSHLDGLTAYVMITENSTVENRIWAVCEERRKLAEAVQGTREELSYSIDLSVPETGATDWLIGLDD